MAWELKTVAKNHTKKVAAVFARPMRVLYCSLSNDFAGEESTTDRAKAALYATDSAKLTHSTGDSRGERYTVSIHSNAWFEMIPV